MENATKLTIWQQDMEIKPSCMMILRIYLLPATLENTLTNHSIPELDGEASTKYSKDPNPHCDLAQLQELSTAPGMTHPIGTYHKPTHAQ